MMAKNNLHAAERLDGYLEAISSLKDDGSYFDFSYLGSIPDEQLVSSYCTRIGVCVDALTLQSLDGLTFTNLPGSLEAWLTARRRLMNPADPDEIDKRLIDGFVEELGDTLGRPHRWFQVGRVRDHGPIHQLGAIWDVYVLCIGSEAFTIHCSWDS
jgi:hypothetical protein